MARRGARVCPECGEPVTPFAAGCSLCGADLEAWRRRREASPRLALPGPRIGHPTLATERSRDLALIAVLVVMAMLSPIFCLVLALVGARDRHLHGRVAARNVILAIGAAALALLFVPSLRFGVFQLLF